MKLFLQEYDALLREALENITNVSLTKNKWPQVTLPVSLGGLGIRQAQDLALPAFLSSAFASNTQSKTILPGHIISTDYDELELGKSELLKRTERGTKTPILTSNQSAWDTRASKIKLLDLLNTTQTKEEQARLLTVSSEHASDLLNAIPIPSLGLKLSNIQVKIARALRLGSNMCHPHICVCGNDVSQLETHSLDCKKAQGVYQDMHRSML